MIILFECGVRIRTLYYLLHENDKASTHTHFPNDSVFLPPFNNMWFIVPVFSGSVRVHVSIDSGPAHAGHLGVWLVFYKIRQTGTYSTVPKQSWHKWKWTKSTTSASWTWSWIPKKLWVAWNGHRCTPSEKPPSSSRSTKYQFTPNFDQINVEYAETILALHQTLFTKLVTLITASCCCSRLG